MEKYEELLVKASNNFKTADHLTYVSYPLLNDKKLLLAIAYNLYLTGSNGISAVLYYERLYKRIEVLPSDLDSRINLFESLVMNRLKIKPEVCSVLRELKLIVDQHRESPLEFSRKDKFVICNDDYSGVKTLDIPMLKIYIAVMREFLRVVSGLRKNV